MLYHQLVGESRLRLSGHWSFRAVLLPAKELRQVQRLGRVPRRGAESLQRMIAVVIVVAIDTAVADAGGGGRLTAGQLDRHSGGSVAGPARLDPGDQHW